MEANMAEFVKFEGKKIGIDKDYELIDSPINMKKISKYYIELLESMNGDDSIESSVKQAPALADLVGRAVGDLLSLTTKQTEGLVNFSFSDQYELFNDCLSKFLGIRMTSLGADDEVEEDPKLPEEEPSGN